MPISDKYRAIFIHIPKNAGTSIIKILDMKRSFHRAWKYYKDTFPDNWNNYFKFAVVRNPWDRVVSNYEYAKMEKSYWHSTEDETKHKDYDLLLGLTFKECLILLKNNPDKFWHPGWKNQYKYIYDEDNKLMINNVYKHENINNQFKNIFNLDLLNINKSIKEYESYKVYYDKESIQLVSEIYEKDIKLFNYKF